MPLPPAHWPVPVQVRVILSEARLAGVAFDDAWPVAVRGAIHGHRERQHWLGALADTRLAWRAAYVGERASRPERALLVIEPADRGDDQEDFDRRCDHCGRPLPLGLKATARYCPPPARCKRQAALDRERAAIAHVRTVPGEVARERGPQRSDDVATPVKAA